MEISVCCTPQPGGGPRVSMLVLLCFCSPQLFCLLQFQPLFLWCLSAAFHVESFAMTSELRSPQASQPLHHGQEEERLQHNTTMTQCYISAIIDGRCRLPVLSPMFCISNRQSSGGLVIDGVKTAEHKIILGTANDADTKDEARGLLR